MDNFHNYATKIKAIQTILFPQQQLQEIEYEICVIPDTDIITISPEDPAEKIKPAKNSTETTYRVSTITTRSHKGRNEANEKAFDNLKKEEAVSAPVSRFEENCEDNLTMIESYKSDDDIPMRDADNADWPSAESSKKIPTKLLENGLLLYKGKRLMRMMSHFYNTSCEICSMKFLKISDLFQHHKNDHKVEPFVSCCSSKLSKLQIIWHFVKHVQPESFKCHICSYVVSRPKFLELHLRTHSNPADKPYSCDKVSEEFFCSFDPYGCLFCYSILVINSKNLIQ